MGGQECIKGQPALVALFASDLSPKGQPLASHAIPPYTRAQLMGRQNTQRAGSEFPALFGV